MASPVSTAVKYFREGMPGGPNFNGTAGSGVAGLRSLFVSGFGLRSVVSASVLDGFVRLVLATEATQVNMLYTVIDVSGATPADANGHQRVMYATATELRYPTDLPDGPVTGTITVMTPGAGWQELFTGTVTNKAAFKRTDPEATPHALLVDDTIGATMGMRGVLTATSADTGTQQFPTAGMSYWQKSLTNDGSGVMYDVFVDSRAIYFMPFCSTSESYYADNRTHSFRFFGDPILGRTTDNMGCLIVGRNDSTNADDPGNGSVYNYAGTIYRNSWAKSWTNIGGPQQAYFCADGRSSTVQSGADDNQGQYPNPYDGVMRMVPIIALEGANYDSPNVVRRAQMPGIFHILHSKVSGYLMPRGPLVPSQDGELLYVLGVGNYHNRTAPPTGAGLMSFLNGWR